MGSNPTAAFGVIHRSYMLGPSTDRVEQQSHPGVVESADRHVVGHADHLPAPHRMLRHERLAAQLLEIVVRNAPADPTVIPGDDVPGVRDPARIACRA